MKKILLLFAQKAVTNGQAHPADLCQALTDAAGGAASYEYALYDDLEHYIDSVNAAVLLPDGRPIDGFDVVYHRRWGDCPDQALATAIFLRKQGVKFIDTEVIRRGSVSKLTQYWRMWEHDLPFPKTVFVSPQRLAGWLADKLLETFELPCILKSTDGTRGADNYLVHSVEEARQVVADNPGVPFMVQAFIPNDGDYRVLVCGDTVGMVVYRQSDGSSHKNNTSLGGSAMIIDPVRLPITVRQLCVRAAQAFHREFAGVDIVIDKHHPEQFYLFEVNRSPQVEASSYVPEKAATLHNYIMELSGGDHAR